MIKPTKPVEPVMPEERIVQDKIKIRIVKSISLNDIPKIDLKKVTKSYGSKVEIEGSFEFSGIDHDGYSYTYLVFTGGKISWESPHYQYGKQTYNRLMKTFPKRLQAYQDKLIKYEEWKANADARRKKEQIISKEKEKRRLEKQLAKITKELNESI